jgi:hypothetical protein
MLLVRSTKLSSFDGEWGSGIVVCVRIIHTIDVSGFEALLESRQFDDLGLD